MHQVSKNISSFDTPGVAGSPMGVKLVALSFDLSRARGFGGVSLF